MSIKGKQHYTILAGANIEVPIVNLNGDEVGYQMHTLEQDVCVFIEETGDVKTVATPTIYMVT